MESLLPGNTPEWLAFSFLLQQSIAKTAIRKPTNTITLIKGLKQASPYYIGVSCIKASKCLLWCCYERTNRFNGSNEKQVGSLLVVQTLLLQNIDVSLLFNNSIALKSHITFQKNLFTTLENDEVEGNSISGSTFSKTFRPLTLSLAFNKGWTSSGPKCRKSFTGKKAWSRTHFCISLSLVLFWDHCIIILVSTITLLKQITHRLSL